MEENIVLFMCHITRAAIAPKLIAEAARRKQAFPHLGLLGLTTTLIFLAATTWAWRISSCY
jgi:ammonia channel protein AmtB